ncbi:hypothetical protein WJX84_002011 [Apatococcus fuscideae]|uniref:Uncharacterized protein n=1 Tax=Apatococcus fuscideae TaxID=2026836 RepID=A0AAW1SD21_9CHLO
MLRSKQDDWRDEDFVELDDEPDWQEDSQDNNGFPSLLSSVLPQALALSDRISEFIFYFFPEGTSRTAVDTIVKAGLALLVLGIARSLLGFVTTIGGIVLAFFILKNFVGKGGSDEQPTRASGRRNRPDKASPRGFLPSGQADSSRDWSNVWLDSKAAKRKRKEPRQ